MAAWSTPPPKSKYKSIFLDKIIGIPPCLKNGIWGFTEAVYAGEHRLFVILGCRREWPERVENGAF